MRVLRFLFGESRTAIRAGICVLVCLPLILSADSPDARLPSIAFCVALGCTAFFGLKRRLIYIGLIIVVQFVAIALNGAGMLLSEVSEEPEVALEPVAISVVPGGDVFHTRISPEQCAEVTVCFYKNGVAVVGAHSCGLSPGVLDTHTLLNDEPVDGQVTLIEDTQWGFAVSPLGPPVEREELPLANPHDISMGEPATCLTPRSEPFDVVVEGWTMRGGRPLLVVSTSRRGNKGMSGSPVIQNGRIIGFLAGTWPLSARPPHIVFVSPAAAVYKEFRDYLNSRAGQ